jgi:prepilin-type N-terminal cleavage/methylation domain-containing protein
MRAHRGFSLIEVLIAVVILSTGLLALAALQGSLTKASADAKVRSQVAALMQGRMDQLRTVGYPAAASVTDSCATNLGTADFVPQAFCDQNGLGAMTVTQTVTTWTRPVGGFNFVPGTPASPEDPQFKRVVLAAAWTDAEGSSNRRLAMQSDISSLGLRDNIVIPPGDSNLGVQGPIVRQPSPAAPGVIPIGIGGQDATAATNPRPTVLGKNNNQSVVGTTFNVLTYTNEASNTVRVQRRIENSLIRCECEYGAAGNNFANLPEIYRQPQWPAVWTGERYDIFKPTPSAPAPGIPFKSAPIANTTQSPLCTECCRDHHDASLVVTQGRFDPLRTDGVGKFKRDNQGSLVAVSNTSSDTYINACRVIRVDGFWRTAADTYARHFGLLATETVNLKPAGGAAPQAAATSAYQTFVKDYMAGYTNPNPPPDPLPAPTNANVLFDAPARGLNNPTSISINRPLPKDERYLHARGLYVDRLEKQARDKIAFELNNCTKTPIVECILPYMPFTTVNVTELAFWEARKNNAPSNNIISVSSGSSLFFDPLQPTRGRTNVLSSASNGDTADAFALLTASNAGLAISTTGVDPQDDVDLSDAQAFSVIASGGSTGSRFSARLIGLPQTGDRNTSNDPAVAYTLGSDSSNCVATVGKNDDDPNDYVCNTNVSLPYVNGQVLIANYWREVDISEATPAGQQCTDSTGTLRTIQATTWDRPNFYNYQVTAASTAAGAAIVSTPAQDGKRAETTTITVPSLNANAVLSVTFGLQAQVKATVASCTATQQGPNWRLNTVSWTRPWL